MAFLLLIYFVILVIVVSISAVVIYYSLKYRAPDDKVPQAIFIYLTIVFFTIWISFISLIRIDWSSIKF